MIIRAIAILLIVFLFNSCSKKDKNSEIEDFIVNKSELTKIINEWINATK